jgi:hypothetical protein
MALMAYEKHPADTGTMTASATTLQQKANQCLDQQEITDQAYNPAVDSWEGICAPELRAAPKPLRDSAQAANTQLAWSAVPINYAVAKITAFNTVAAECQTLADTADPKPAEGAADVPASETNAGRASKRYYEAYDTHIIDGFAEAAKMFKDGPTSDNVALASAAGAIPNAPVFKVFGQMWHEANMKTAATEAEDLIKAINEGKWGDDMKSKLGPLTDLLKKYGTDQMFAAMLLNKIGPDGMLRLNQIVAQSSGDDKPDPYSNKDGGPQDNELGDMIGEFQKQLGITLGTATGGQDGYEPGTRDDYKLAPGFVDKLNELGREKSAIKWPGEDDYEYGQELYGYQVLAPLLRNGAYSSDFLTNVGNGMYYMDRYTEGEHGGPVWMDTIPDVAGGNHGVRLDWTSGIGSDDSSGFDPMQALMQGLGNNPQASHDFFTDSRTYSSDGDPDTNTWDENQGYNDKARYFLTERSWNLPGDQPFHGDGVKEDGYYDKDLYKDQNNTHPMDTLGKALTAATTGVDDPKAAQLFGDVIHELAQHEGGDKDKGFNDKDIVPPDLRDDLADMSSHYIGTINQLYDGNAVADGMDADPVRPGVQHFPGLDLGGKGSPTLDSLDMMKVLADVGKNDDAASHVSAAQSIYMQQAYDHYLNSGGTLPDRLDALNTQVNTPTGKILGALDFGDSAEKFNTDSGNATEHNDSVEDKYKMIGFVKDMVPIDKVPGGSLLGIGVDEYLDGLKESEKVDYTGITNSYIGNLRDGTGNDIHTTAQALLYANMPEEDLMKYKEIIPLTDDGRPKPISEWDASDQTKWANGLNDESASLFNNAGQDAREKYISGFDEAKGSLESHLK